MSGFSFKGVHSSKFGIYTQDQSRTLLPPKREGKITIPGRSGYYDDVGAVYNERAESVLCSFVCPEGKTVPEVCREIAYWLSGSGRAGQVLSRQIVGRAAHVSTPQIWRVYDHMVV